MVGNGVLVVSLHKRGWAPRDVEESMGYAVTRLVHSYGFRIDGEHECKSGVCVERVQKSNNMYVDLDCGGLAALLADLVGEGMGNIMVHALVKGFGDLTSGRSGTSMPIGYSAAVRDDDNRGGLDRALAGARA